MIPRIATSLIAKRLTKINMLASGTALLVACAILMAYDFTTYRATILRNGSILAEIIGSNTETALVFGDTGAAERTLGALRAAHRIEAAGLYSAAGQLFASYERDPGLEPIALPAVASDVDQWHAFETLRRLHVIRRVRLGGAPIGTVYIRSDMQEMRQRLWGYVIMFGAVLLMSLLAAGVVSRVAQRSISEPITALAAVAARLSADRDYSVRVTTTGQGELGVLIDAFNEMLTQIHDQDRSLRESHELLEARVRERTDALKDSNNELEAFCYSVSHDLRSPLRGIDGFSAALLEDLDGRLDEKSAGHLRRIRAATQRMGMLIDDLLNLSRVTRTDMTRKPLDLSALARLVVADRRLADADRRVTTEIADGLAASGDPRLLRQVLENLIGNAWKFTSRQAEPVVQFGAMSRDDETVYFVRDNGAGFDPLYAHRLFGVFQRLHTMTDFPGTGVGLAIVDRIVRRHGGRVWAEGIVGQGATFYFTLADQAAGPDLWPFPSSS